MLVRVNSRWEAFGIHLLLSSLVLLAVAAVVIFFWYPGEFGKLGGLFGLKIITGVDVVLGPLLTLIVFNKAKKNLKWDLTAIGFIQLSALGYGLWAVELGRPIAQVLNHKGVYIVTQADLDYYNLEKSSFFEFGKKLPVRVFMDLPTDLDKINQIAFTTEFSMSKPLELRLDLYEQFYQKNTQVKFYLDNMKENKNKGCYEVKINSLHEQLQGCIKELSGQLLIKK